MAKSQSIQRNFFFRISYFPPILLLKELQNSINRKILKPKAGLDRDKNFLFWETFWNFPCLRSYRALKLFSSYLITEERGCLGRCYEKTHRSMNLRPKDSDAGPKWVPIPIFLSPYARFHTNVSGLPDYDTKCRYLAVIIDLFYYILIAFEQFTGRRVLW